MAEAMLRRRLTDREPTVRVGSVGLMFDDRPAESGAVKAMRKRGIDLTDFRSRIATSERVAGASLVLAMERVHVREISVLADGLFDRTFTLIEFVEGAEIHGPRRQESFDDWVAKIGRHRKPADYLFDDPSTEVPDPMGRSNRTFRQCADTIDDLLGRLVDLAWPLPADSSGGDVGALDPSTQGGR